MNFHKNFAPHVMLLAALIATANVSADTPAARMGDTLIGDLPPEGVIITGSPTVLVNGQPAARLGDTGVNCVVLEPFGPFGTLVPFTLPPLPIADGNPTVLINGQPAARLGDRLADPRCRINRGSSNVFY